MYESQSVSSSNLNLQLYMEMQVIARTLNFTTALSCIHSYILPVEYIHFTPTYLLIYLFMNFFLFIDSYSLQAREQWDMQSPTRFTLPIQPHEM